ncbi:type I-E CRISPR-associated protein Cse1/CasA [Streptomyces sp. NPDC058486]|uniref:type I-E CRISPR-associated protein Cse1/CasA n=1 Tax=unclassified Streptomyces TaxID=2593676 RepID=UPI00365C392B
MSTTLTMLTAPKARPSWDPRHEPCVPTVSLDGEVADLSLLDVLFRAEELATLACPTPGEGVAVLEHLLAVCFASGVHPSSTDEWCAWVAASHPLTAAARWLAEQPPEEWDLFHPERPLGQNSRLASLMPLSGTGPAQLVLERAGDYLQFFDHHHLGHPEPLPAAAAFRAMLAQHVYGLSGRARLSGQEHGPRLTNLAAARLQGRIRVVVQSRTVADMLRLNLYPPAGGRVGQFNLSWTTGEIPRREFREKPPGRATTGPADLHSYLGRSILLRAAPGTEGGEVAVDRVLVGAGELLALDLDRDLEDAVFKEEATDGVRRPLWPSATRALWREAHALYSAAQNARQGLFGRLRLLEFPQETGGIPCRLWAVGLIADKTKPDAWTEGSFPYAPSQGEALCTASRRGSVIADYLADSLKRAAFAASRVIYPNPKPSDKAAQQARFDARKEFWPAAEDPFLRLLADTALGSAVDTGLLRYADELLACAEEFMRHRLDSLPHNAEGMQARARAEKSFADDLTKTRAPEEIRKGRA